MLITSSAEYALLSTIAYQPLGPVIGSTGMARFRQFFNGLLEFNIVPLARYRITNHRFLNTADPVP